MIRRLKTRARFDKYENQVRLTRAAKGRFLYLALLFGLAIFALKLTLGPLFIFGASGLVTQKQHVVSALFQARVAEVFVKEGERVEVGQPILRSESATVLREIADLSTRVAQLTTRAAQIRAQAKATSALLPLARRSDNETKRSVDNLDRLKKQSLVTESNFAEALTVLYESQARYEKLKAEQAALAEEIDKIEQAKKEAVVSLDKLKALYNDGVVHAQSTGVVGPKIPSSGEVYRVGEDMMRIYSGRPYILAYVPESYFFSVGPGERVSISVGNRTVEGMIIELLPVADSLPPEFQNTFKPRSRSRVIRASINEDADIAVSQTVHMTYCHFGNCNWTSTAVALASDVYLETKDQGDAFLKRVSRVWSKCQKTLSWECVRSAYLTEQPRDLLGLAGRGPQGI